MEARRQSRGPFALAVVAGCLLAWGAFSLIAFTDDEDLNLFWIRLAVGVAVAGVTVWAAWHEHWLATTFLALACCITPVAQDWALAQLLCIALAIWALVLFLTHLVRGSTV